MATKLIPLTQSIRDGILYMAGGSGKESRYEVTRKIEKLESEDKIRRINSAADAEDENIKKDAEKKKWDVYLDPNATGGIQRDKHWQEMQAKIKDGTATPEEIDQFKDWVKHETYNHGGTRYIGDDAADKLAEIDKQRNVELDENGARRSSSIDSENKAAAKRLKDIEEADRAQLDAPTKAKSVKDFDTQEQRDNVAAFLDTIGASEGAGYNTIVGGGKFDDYSKHPNKVGLVTGDGPSTAAGKYQIVNSTWEPIAKKLGLKDFSPESQDKAAIELLREKGALDDILRGDFHTAAKKLGGTWQSMPTGTSGNQGKRSWPYFDSQMERQLEKRKAIVDDDSESDRRPQMDSEKKPAAIADEDAPPKGVSPDDTAPKNAPPPLLRRPSGIESQELPPIPTKGTPLPPEAAAKQVSEQRFIFDASPLEVIHKNERGENIAPRQQLATTVKPASPFGTQRVA